MIELAALAMLWGAAPDSAGIMARVAENQQRAVEMRSAFVYQQNVLVRLDRRNGKLAREEMSDFTVTPTAGGFERKLERFAGKLEKDGKTIEYGKTGHRFKGMDVDAELASGFAEEFAGQKQSRDGVAPELFPLTPERQKHYIFKLEGRGEYLGRDIWRVTFRPRADESSWAGEVLVDAAEYQPVLVTTWLARGVPLVVRTVLGTNVRHVGFKVEYAKFGEGVWFPVRYGGEFDIRAVFFYRRKISISAVNSGFRQADVDSRVSFHLPR